MLKKRLLVFLFVIFPLVVGLACLSSAPDPTATPTEEKIVEPTKEPTEEPTKEPTEEPTQEPTEKPTEEPTVEITEEPTQEETQVSGDFQDLVLLDKSFWIQDEDMVFVSFFFENPNSDLVFEDVEYTIYLLDANGNEIDNEYSTIRWFFPGQVIGVSFNFYLSEEDITVDSATVDWTYEDTSPPDGMFNPFGAEQLNYWPNEGYPMVTGKITNSSTDTYTDIQTNVICYDAAGEIVGGGYTYINFIPGEDYMGFSTYVDVYGEVASVEVFPIFTYSTLYYEGSEFWDEISITGDYFYEDDWGNLYGGITIQNNIDTVLSDSVVYATFYDEADNITSTGTAYVDMLLPGDTLGVAPWNMTPPEGADTVRYDVLVLPGEYEDGYELTENPFTVNSTTLTGDYNDTVLVNFTNNYSKQVSEVEVYVLVYDAEGNIIGGGSNWTEEPTPAGGSSEIEVWVDYDSSRTVASIKAWVSPNYWTEFE